MRNEPSKKAKFTPRSLHDVISSQMGISSEIVQEILETTPKAAELVDSEGKLPLHIAYINSATNDIVTMLIHHYPAAAEVKDNYGNLPFHYACSENSCWDTIKEALELYPKAIEIKNRHGYLPLHLAWEQSGKYHFNLVLRKLIEVYPAAVAVPFPDGQFLLSKALLCKGVSDEVLKMIIEMYPEAAEVQRNGYTPLHVTLYKRNPISEDVLLMLIKAAPKAACVQDYDGNLPLHHALHTGRSSNVIVALLEVYPKGAEVQDENGELPLHLACQDDLSADVIKMLLRIYPNAAKMKNKNGELPINDACWNQKCILEKLDALLLAHPESINVECVNLQNWLRHERSTLKRAVIKRYSVLLVKLLVKTDPKQCSIPDIDGNFPVHFTCGLRGIDFSPEIVKVLADASPNSFIRPNNFGKTAKCILEEVASDTDEAGRLMLHRLAAFSTDLTATAVHFFVDVFPVSITVPDNNGMLAFHHACLNAGCSVEALFTFLQLYPECIKKRPT